MMAYIYFKEKHGDGYRVFAKDDKISKSQIDAYIKNGCVKCDADGKELKTTSTKKAK